MRLLLRTDVVSEVPPHVIDLLSILDLVYPYPLLWRLRYENHGETEKPSAPITKHDPPNVVGISLSDDVGAMRVTTDKRRFWQARWARVR